MNAADYGGQGGRGYTNNGGLISTGGGNPGGNQDSDGGSPQRAGDGNGGIIWLVVGGDLTIGASGIITAQGNNSWPGADGAGGATGGGAIHALHAGTLTNNGSITAAGGTESATRGAAGGAGGVNTTLVSPKTYADLTLVSTATTAVQAADPTKGDIVFTYTNETLSLIHI